MFEFSYIMKEFIGEYPCYILTPMRDGILDMVYVQSFFLAMYRYLICLHGKKVNCLGQHVSTYILNTKSFSYPSGRYFGTLFWDNITIFSDFSF